MLYLLGVITGLLLATLVAILTFRFKPSIERFANQTESKFKPKGSIIEPEDELEDWVDSLPEK